MGTTSSPWIAVAGTHTVTAVVDDVNRFAESNESNNRYPASGTVSLTFRKRDALKIVGQRVRYHPSGYSGGQVNPTSGDFVFNCRAIYTLDRQGVALHKPAIFSGSMFGALGALRETFGPLKLDALGYCGKWGQSVPSSGGSHYFLFLEPDERVRLGGS